MDKGIPRTTEVKPFIHSSQDLQCTTPQPYRTQNWENTYEELKLVSKKPIHDITNFGNPSNSRRCKKHWGSNIICKLLQGLWLHTQREDGANTSRLRLPQRYRRSHNDAIQKHEGKSLLPEWRLLPHWSRSATRRHTSLIPVYHLPRLRA